MKNLDLIDILIHVSVAALACLALSLMLPAFFVIVLNTLFWPLRESLQGIHKKGWWNPSTWSVQKHAEAWPPVLIGVIIALLTSVWV